MTTGLAILFFGWTFPIQIMFTVVSMIIEFLTNL